MNFRNNLITDMGVVVSDLIHIRAESLFVSKRTQFIYYSLSKTIIIVGWPGYHGTQKYKKHVFNVSPNEHPKYIQKKLSELNENQLGFECFGLKHTVKKDTIEIIKRKILKLKI